MSTSWNIDLSDPNSISDADLASGLEILAGERHRRSLAAADPAALTEQGFTDLFDQKGAAKTPTLTGGVLVAAGSKIDRSAMSHVCRFVRVGKDWVWESPNRFNDAVHYVPGAKQHMQSITLVTVAEGDAVDLIESRTRSGLHELVSVASYIVRSGTLELVSTRSVQSGSHR